MKGLHGALVRFRIMAWVTGVLLAVMSVVFLPLKYVKSPFWGLSLPLSSAGTLACDGGIGSGGVAVRVPAWLDDCIIIPCGVGGTAPLNPGTIKLTPPFTTPRA